MKGTIHEGCKGPEKMYRDYYNDYVYFPPLPFSLFTPVIGHKSFPQEVYVSSGGALQDQEAASGWSTVQSNLRHSSTFNPALRRMPFNVPVLSVLPACTGTGKVVIDPSVSSRRN